MKKDTPTLGKVIEIDEARDPGPPGELVRQIKVRIILDTTSAVYQRFAIRRVNLKNHAN